VFLYVLLLMSFLLLFAYLHICFIFLHVLFMHSIKLSHSITPIQPTHAPINVDLTAEGTPDNRSPSLRDQDKLFALEERLRAVEGNDWFDPMRAAEVCRYQTL